MKRPLVFTLLIVTSCIALGMLVMMGTLVFRGSLTAEKQALQVVVPTGGQLAEKEKSALPPATDEISVFVKNDGSILFQGTEVTRAELSQRLGNLSAAQKRQPVRVSGEADTNYQVLVDLVGLCQKSGLLLLPAISTN